MSRSERRPGPWIDLHGHAGRCFLAGLPAGHPMVASLGAASVASAGRDAAAAGMTALTLATVSDFAVLRPDPVTGLRAHREFRAGVTGGRNARNGCHRFAFRYVIG